MSSSISVPRSPPSPASVPTAHKKVKLATIDGDFAEPVQQASGSGSGSSSNPTAADGKVDNGKKNGKKESKQRSRRAPPIDEVLLHDLLSTLGWSELPKPSDPPSQTQTLGQRLWPKTAPAWKSSRGGKKAVEPVANEENENKVEQPASNDWGFTEAEFTVVALTSHGDGIAVYPVAPEKPQWAIIMPFTLPGDVVKAKVTRHQHYHSFADPLEIISSNPSASTFPIQTTRDDSLVGCKYFGTCAGCQYQSLPYEQQLALKRHVLVKAMKNFANLPSEQIPEVKETIPSPKQYNYRTKITPHFELPKALQTGKKGRQALNRAKKNNATLAAEAQAQEEQAGNEQNEIPAELDTPIGFEGKCKPGILDIEVCPIATEAIMSAMPAARAAVKQNIRSYKRGATLLLRDSLVNEVSAGGSSETEQKEAEKVDPVVDVPAGVMDEEEQGMNEGSTPEVAIAPKRSSKGKTIDLGLSTDVKLKSPEEHVCVSVHSHTVTERVGDIIFQFPAGSFFQNNASILGPLTSFARDQIDKDSDEKKESYLVDAYCGSGLFSLTLAEHFTQVCGIEIDPNSIAYARHNALVNKISNATFHAGASESLFDTVTQSLAWPGDKTTLIVDPPRKGCDEGFLGQVVKFNPKRIVYVSCNVHTMARDVGQLVRNSNAGGAKGYKIDSLGAIDLFPQTHHTEGLCVLTREV